MIKEKLFAVTESLSEYFLYGFIFFTPIGHAGASVFFVLLALCFVIRKAIHPDFSFLKKTEHFWLLLFFIFCALSLVNSGPYLQKSLWALFFKWGQYLLVFLFFRDALTRSCFMSIRNPFSCPSFPHAPSGNPGIDLYSGSSIKTFGDDKLKHNAMKATTTTYEAASSHVRQKRVGWVILTVAAIIGIDCLIQFFSGTDFFYTKPLLPVSDAYKALTATFNNQNDLASYLGFVTLVALAMAVIATTRKFRWLLWSLTVFLGTCLLRTYSRGAWVGLLGGLFLMLLISRRWKTLLPVLPVFVLAILSKASIAKRITDFFLYATGQSADVSIIARFDYWRLALQMIRENPFLGKGLGTFMDHCGQRALTLETNYAHNCYLQMCAESGIFSLLAFLLFLGTMFAKGIKTFRGNRDPLLLGLLCGLFAFLMHSFVDTQFYSVAQAYLLWSMLGILAAATDSVTAPVPLPKEIPVNKSYSVLGGFYKEYKRRKQIIADGRTKLLTEKTEDHPKIIIKKILTSLGLILMILSGVVLTRCFENLIRAEAQIPTMAQAPIKNYENIQQAGIDTAKEAMLHEPVLEAPEAVIPSAVVSPPESVNNSFDVMPLPIPASISKALVDAPFNPAILQKNNDEILRQAGVKTKEDAMEFTLAQWEKRRKAYIS